MIPSLLQTTIKSSVSSYVLLSESSTNLVNATAYAKLCKIIKIQIWYLIWPYMAVFKTNIFIVVMADKNSVLEGKIILNCAQFSTRAAVDLVYYYSPDWHFDFLK